MDYQRQQSRFTYKGVHLNSAVDNVPPEKLAIGTNVRPNQQGTLSTRPAISSLLTPSGAAVHSLKSFNAAAANYTFSGAGLDLYLGDTLIDSGYSGNPLSWAAYQPSAAVQPFLYAADSARYMKARAVDGSVFQVGSVPPGGPCAAEIGIPLYAQVFNPQFEDTGWVAAGACATPTFPARVPVTTTITEILYDSGATGWACVSFTNGSTGGYPDWLAKGVRITLAAGFSNQETAVVSQLVQAALSSTTTIAAIQYDSGTTGAACVVLAANTANLERNALVELNTEFVRVLSVAVGDDNSVSFRCVTVGTHATGETVSFVNSARMYLAQTHVVTEAASGYTITSALSLLPSSQGKVNVSGTAVTYASGSGDTFDASGAWNGLTIIINGIPYVIATVSSTTALTITTNAGSSAGSGGWPYSVTPPSIGTLTYAITLDLSQIGGRPITGDDWMHISMLLDQPENLILAQILLDVDQTTNNFTQNYYWATITQNILQALATGTGQVLSAQQAALEQATTAAELETLQNVETAALGNSQLATGNSAWSEVFIPISQILAGRVGSDETRSLANVQAIQILISVSAPCNLSADSWWIGGGYGPNAPESIYPDNPIEYCYRYRSTITGAQTTWSDLTRGGLFPERMPVVISGPGSTDPQIDTVDIARVGASVDGTPQELVSIPNASTWSYTDNYSDAQLEDQIEQVDFQPWPVQQNPITGTCSVVGTTVFATSVAIPGNLCAGTLVLINGVATVIRGAPVTVTGVSNFQIEDNIAAATGAPFQINSPTTYGNPLPYLAGPFDETFFAWGDPVNPGRIYYSNRTNPEGANTSNFIDVTSADEPGLGMCTWNGYVIAMTGDRFFSGTTTGNTDTPYAFTETSVGTGLLSPWCFDVGPAIFFLSKNGLLATDLGPAKSLSGPDLYPFLPHEAQPGVSINGYSPPLLSPVPRLSFLRNGWLYFDYQIAGGTYQTLALNTLDPGWWFDVYLPGVTLHAQNEAPGSFGVLVGCADGSVQQFTTGGSDTGGPIACQARPGAWTAGDFRNRKQFGDAYVDCDASVSTAGIVATLLADNWIVTLASTTLTGPQSVNRLPLDISSGHGSFNVNACLDFTWTGLGTLYGFEITALAMPVRTQLRTTDWIDLGQSVYLQGLRVTANTGGVSRAITIEYDGYPTAGGVIPALAMDHDGIVQLPYSFTPVIAHRIRLTPTDSGDVWELYAVEPIGPKAPEAVTTWQPQPTSHGLQGYQTVREFRPVLQGTGICVLAGTCEFGSFSLPITLTGVVQKFYLSVPANKGMLYGWSITGGPVRVFEDDFEVVVKQWGAGGPFQIVHPFGEGQTEGARI